MYYMYIKYYIYIYINYNNIIYIQYYSIKLRIHACYADNDRNL